MDYVEYKNTIRALKDILGLSCINHWDTEELHECAGIVLGYLCRELTLKDTDNNLMAIKELCGIIDAGNSVLLGEGISEFKEFLGTDTQDDIMLTVAWTNICTSLWESAKCNYAALIWELEHQGCGCPCGCGDQEITEEDNLYTKLSENGARFTVDDTGNPKRCGCTG